MRTDIGDMQLRVLTATWSEAVLTQYSRLKIHYENGGSGSKYQGKFDTVFLLEALHQLCRLFEIVKIRFPNSLDQLKLIMEFSHIICELRNMNIHSLDYFLNKGHKQERFVAETRFKHDATTIQIIEGNLIVGGRLNLTLCVDCVSEINNIVDPRSGSLWS